MDFDSFLKDPIAYTKELAQKDTIEWDLGIRRQLNKIFNQNPERIEEIPLVITAKDIQKIVPGSLIRLRCIVGAHIGKEYFNFRYHNGEDYDSCLLDEHLHGDFTDEPPKETIGERNLYIGHSLTNISPWMKDILLQSTESEDNGSAHTINKKINSNALSPFQILIKATFAQSPQLLSIVDIVGVLSKPNTEFYDSDQMNVLSESIIGGMQIFGLTYMPVPTLFGSMEQRASFDVVSNFIQRYFEPIQSHLILMWLISSVMIRPGDIPMGTFSLNFTGANQEQASQIQELLQNLVAALAVVELDAAKLNRRDIAPAVDSSDVALSPLFVFSGTRIFVNETIPQKMTFNDRALKNISCLKSIADDQIAPFTIEREQYSAVVSCPLIVISTDKSAIDCDVTIPLGKFDPVELPSPEELEPIRVYFECVRNNVIQPAESEVNEVSRRLAEAIGEFPGLTQERFQLLYLFVLLEATASQEKINNDTWERAKECFSSVINTY